MALLDQQQMESISPFFGTGLGKVTGKVLKSLLNLNAFADCYDKSAVGGAMGPDFAHNVLLNTGADYRVSGIGRLKALVGQGPFITVSNHPFGAIDGIILIYLIGSRRPQFKVMVNMLLNYISAMRPNFIAVDQSASQDPEKRAVSVNGIRSVLKQLRAGEPIGFFPAGAMSKTTLRDGLQDRPWQDSVLQIIYKAKVPVIPIFFHGRNSRLCNIMGHVCWPLRSLMIPSEMFKKSGTTVKVTVGEPISVEEQSKFDNPRSLGDFLRMKTYELKKGRPGAEVCMHDR